MKVSYFSDLWSDQPLVYEVSWTDLCGVFTRHTERPDKGGALYAPGELEGWKAEDVRRICFGVLDVDGPAHEGIEHAAFMAICERLSRYDAIVYTTHRYAEVKPYGRWKARIVIRLDRDVAPEEWSDVWDALNATFGGVCDSQCRDASHRYYFPTCPPGAPREAVVFRGEPWHVPDIGELRKAAVESRNDPISVTAVKRFATTLEKRPRPFDRRMGTLLQMVLRGEPFAAEGERDVRLFELCRTLAARWPYADAAQLAELFAPSLELMRGAEGPDVRNAEGKIRRAQERVLAVPLVGVTREARIAEAFHGERTSPYSLEELETFGDMKGRWIVQRGVSYWLGFNGSYIGPFGQADVRRAAATFLAPAPVELVKLDKQGTPVSKSPEELVEAYGRVVERVEASLSAQVSYLEHDRHVFVEATCPLRVTRPEYSEEIARWLSLLGGAKKEKLLDWIATCTNLELPAPALYVRGATGVGKGLLAAGLSRLWTKEGATRLEAVMASFNDAVTRCPLVFGDEQVPKNWKGDARTEELRELIATTRHPWRRKYVDDSTIHGAVRVVLAANNDALLSLVGELTQDDAAALSERVLHIRAGEAVAQHLKALGGRKAVEQWVEGDGIARHALWLRAERKVEAGRFAVQGDSTELMQTILTSGGPRWAVCSWLWSWAQDPTEHLRLCAQRGPAVFIAHGRLWVSASRLAQSWDHYHSGERAPTRQTLAKALASLGGAKPKKTRFGGQTYETVDVAALAAWIESQGESAAGLHGLLVQPAAQVGAIAN